LRCDVGNGIGLGILFELVFMFMFWAGGRLMCFVLVLGVWCCILYYTLPPLLFILFYSTLPFLLFLSDPLLFQYSSSSPDLLLFCLYY
jgi:hypothetical protein